MIFMPRFNDPHCPKCGELRTLHATSGQLRCVRCFREYQREYQKRWKAENRERQADYVVKSVFSRSLRRLGAEIPDDILQLKVIQMRLNREIRKLIT